jgi:hypothetical protein
MFLLYNLVAVFYCTSPLQRLRVYQQKCENFDTVIHPYTSCPYAWDEPCFPHRLTVEVCSPYPEEK